MKQLLLILFIALVVFTGFRTYEAPPNSRIGYLSINRLVSEIPEYSANRGKLDTMIYEFNVTLEGKITEWQQKRQAFAADSATMNDVIRQDKIKELQSLSQAIQAFKQVSEEEVARQESALVQPILNEIQTAIEQVAEKKGYTHILNTDVRAVNGPPLVLYANDQSDVSQQVLEEYHSMNK